MLVQQRGLGLGQARKAFAGANVPVGRHITARVASRPAQQQQQRVMCQAGGPGSRGRAWVSLCRTLLLTLMFYAFPIPAAAVEAPSAKAASSTNRATGSHHRPRLVIANASINQPTSWPHG